LLPPHYLCREASPLDECNQSLNVKSALCSSSQRSGNNRAFPHSSSTLAYC